MARANTSEDICKLVRGLDEVLESCDVVVQVLLDPEIAVSDLLEGRPR